MINSDINVFSKDLMKYNFYIKFLISNAIGIYVPRIQLVIMDFERCTLANSRKTSQTMSTAERFCEIYYQGSKRKHTIFSGITFNLFYVRNLILGILSFAYTIRYQYFAVYYYTQFQ